MPDEIAVSEGYAVSQQKLKLIGPIRQVTGRGLKKVADGQWHLLIGYDKN